MEKLTAAQQQGVKKMSDERLRLKLVAAGYEEDVVVAMERETMLSTYAEFLASGGVRPGAAAQVGYDPDVEAQNNNNNNNNKHDNVYGAVIMAEPLREFSRFI